MPASVLDWIFHRRQRADNFVIAAWIRAKIRENIRRNFPRASRFRQQPCDSEFFARDPSQGVRRIFVTSRIPSDKPGKSNALCAYSIQNAGRSAGQIDHGGSTRKRAALHQIHYLGNVPSSTFSENQRGAGSPDVDGIIVLAQWLRLPVWVFYCVADQRHRHHLTCENKREHHGLESLMVHGRNDEHESCQNPEYPGANGFKPVVVV